MIKIATENACRSQCKASVHEESSIKINEKRLNPEKNRVFSWLSHLHVAWREVILLSEDIRGHFVSASKCQDSVLEA